jgi:multisubunit Na+/H+ antiporter MnhE subunit
MKSSSPKTLLIVFLNAIIYFALYLAFTSNTGFRELIAGAFVAGVATLATLVFSSAGKVQFRFQLRDVLEAWRIPWSVVSGTVEVLHGLSKQLFTRAGAPSFLAAVPFRTGNPRSLATHGRCALAVTYTTATPNFIVIGIIEEQKLLLYHQILPGEVITMTRNLGAGS